uniref:Replication factor C C-terminal domain-containing protein n=1 Tax=viral metagenome TaxID=1070528 RepID=A0A6C0FC66_9ZZZZ|tara:strand:- start:7590 stop:8555 length:966 start_codon:yes stop_codon:yes gene_type:complete
MKHFETHFDEYIQASDECNFYPKHDTIYQSFSNEIKNMHNLILYGRSGCGKYTQALKIISKYSPSALKYEKKLQIHTNKNNYIIKISDVHFEIDMSLLGCNAKILWHEWYNQIIEIVSGRPVKAGIILCKNMHMINNDLLDIFYSYIQNNSMHKNIHIAFIFITESICFLPENILNCCEVIGYGQPLETKVKKQIKKYNSKGSSQYNEDVQNIKQLYVTDISKQDVHEDTINGVIEMVLSGPDNIEFSKAREKLYELFIYEVDIHSCVWKLLKALIKQGMINNDNIGKIICETQKFFTLFNNNYRPIYHLERYIYVIMCLL